MNDNLVKESLQDLYEQAPCGYIFTLPDGTFGRVNQTFLSWTGYTRDDLITTKRFQDLLTVPGKLFYENQYAPLLWMQGFVTEITFDLVCQNRSTLPVLVNSVQRQDSKGHAVMIASTIFEVPERRAYERELLLARNRAEQLAAVVTAASDAIVSCSSDGTIQTWNAGAERLFAYTAEEIHGRHLRDVLSLPKASECERIGAELRAGRALHIECAGRASGHRRLDVSVSLTPHRGLLGELTTISAIIRDISERRSVERLQQEFLAMASHELRNPLTAIGGRAQLMKRSGRYSEQAIDAIIAQTDQLGRLINDLLLASQIEADRLNLHMVEIDLVPVARAAADDLLPDRATIQVVAPDAPVPVLADAQRLGQVFASLLTNAVKYSADGSEIVVRITQSAGKARIAITDRGAGIPLEALPHLFGRFYRVQSTAAHVQCLGLGLFITSRIVEGHGGTISVESEVGRGSTFTITLPLFIGTRPHALVTASGTQTHTSGT
ncbi:MAG: hypothetical protein PVSMB7_08140 [Chloroflexota bacterium]